MIDLYGYKYSVYAWIVRFALHEKAVAYNWIEVNPFADDVDSGYLDLHPFCRVPTLVNNGFVLYETGAITRYIDEIFEHPKLMPVPIEHRARVNQILSVIDSYTYWPLVRQVFAHGVMGPRLGRSVDPDDVERGLAASTRTLDALENLATGGTFLIGDALSLADVHLAPMVSYFTEHDQGRQAIARHARLNDWFTAVSRRAALLETKPDLPEPLAQ
jgi:glutathione S-transferase